MTLELIARVRAVCEKVRETEPVCSTSGWPVGYESDGESEWMTFADINALLAYVTTLEGERDAQKEDAELMRWLFDVMGGGFTHEEEKYGMSNSAWGKWPDDWRDALRKAREKMPNGRDL